MVKNSPLLIKSKELAVQVVKIHDYLQKNKKEFELSKQLYRSGTSVGANSKEAAYASSKKDFYNKCSIALKEAAETEYWLDVLHDTGYLNDAQYIPAYQYCQDCISILVKTIQKKNKESEDDIDPAKIEI